MLSNVQFGGILSQAIAQILSQAEQTLAAYSTEASLLLKYKINGNRKNISETQSRVQSSQERSSTALHQLVSQWDLDPKSWREISTSLTRLVFPSPQSLPPLLTIPRAVQNFRAPKGIFCHVSRHNSLSFVGPSFVTIRRTFITSPKPLPQKPVSTPSPALQPTSFFSWLLSLLPLPSNKSSQISARNKIESLLEAHSNDPQKQRRLLEAYLRGFIDVRHDIRSNSGEFLTLVLFFACLAAAFVIFQTKFKQSGDLNIPTVTNKAPVTNVSVTFADVQGCDEAKQELQNVVAFLRDPTKFQTLGAKLPRGVLLVGPPGVGKTLLAKAVAGEAQVTFLHACGSEFDDKLVGVGAARLRQLFQQARTSAPCVVFIDEFDAVGKRRTRNRSAPYANQTVNQLLAEMDGFSNSEGIIVLAATNLKEQLDKAVLRPGRFDLEVNISLPELEGRMALFHLYLSKVQHNTTSCSPTAVEQVARRSTGFTGADIRNVINQAAIRAAMEGRSEILMEDVWHAHDKLLMGPSRGRIPDEEQNELTAYHEAGHALVCLLTADSPMRMHKLTILPRRQSLGHMSYIPEKDTYGMSKAQLQARMDVCMGGRVAEEMCRGAEKVTSGASSDFEAATQIAEGMVSKFGMSTVIGPRVIEEEDVELSDTTHEAVDAEVKRLLQESYERVRNLLHQHRRELEMLATAVLKYETLDKEDAEAILAGKEPKCTVPIKKNDKKEDSNVGARNWWERLIGRA